MQAAAMLESVGKENTQKRTGEQLIGATTHCFCLYPVTDRVRRSPLTSQPYAYPA